MNNTETTVLLFNTGKGNSQLHVAGCAAINLAGRKSKFVVAPGSELEDVEERGYKVVRCKCLKGA